MGCWMEKTLMILLLLLAVKTITGFKWPWEICSCCKKKQRDHKK